MDAKPDLFRPLPTPKHPVVNFLVIYCYADGNVEVSCSTMEPIQCFELLAIAADAMCKYQREMEQPNETAPIEVVGHG